MGNQGEPLTFELGAGMLLRGMELAIEGMCVGQGISVVIPPHLAYDDPSKKFNFKDGKRPCPKGAHVRYEIELVSASGFDKSDHWVLLFGFIVLLAIFGIFGAFMYYADDRSSAKGKNGKK